MSKPIFFSIILRFSFTLLLCFIADNEARAALDIQIGDTMTITGTVSRDYGRVGYISYDGNWSRLLAGAFDVNVEIGAGNEGRILAFCTDILKKWHSGVEYTALGFEGQSGVNPGWSAQPESIQNAAWLYNTYLDDMQAQGLSRAQKKNRGAGIQLAIWEVLYETVENAGVGPGTDGDFNLSSGLFSASKFRGGKAYGQEILGDLVSARSDGSFIEFSSTWLKPVNDDSQGLIYSPVPVPEVSTIIAGVLLLIPLAANLMHGRRRAGLRAVGDNPAQL